MANIDLQAVLSDWPHDPEQISVRKVVSAEGAVRIQMRVELGLLQMEVGGRPDGVRPHGFATALQYHQDRLGEHEARNGTSLGFVLTPDDCLELRIEGSQFYRRYIAFFVLEEYPAVLKDTSHTLAVFDLCKNFAMRKGDRECLEPYRPYVIMMDARARAYDALQQKEHASALAHVNRGVLHIKAHFDASGKPEGFESCQEVKVLQTLGAEVSTQIPADSIVVQNKALRTAIAEERFEEAARLRDAIRNQGKLR